MWYRETKGGEGEGHPAHPEGGQERRHMRASRGEYLRETALKRDKGDLFHLVYQPSLWRSQAQVRTSSQS